MQFISSDQIPTGLHALLRSEGLSNLLEYGSTEYGVNRVGEEIEIPI
jgi:hypothetical protein